MIFQSELTSLESELSQLEILLTAKRQELGFFQNLQSQADECLERLSRVVNHAKESTAHGAIASLKTAVLTLFTDDDGTGDDGGNQPNDPAPTDPSPECDPDDDFDIIALNGETGDCLTTDDLEALSEDDTSTGTARLTYAQVIKNRCSACWGYEVTSKADIKAGFVNHTSLNFMEAVNLEHTGREFYETVEVYLDRLYYNGQACQLEDCPESSRTGQSYDWATSFACLLWEDAPLLGQACVIEVPPYMELVKVSDALAYQRKHDGEIVCTYIGFKTKAIAQSWLHFFEAITSKVELRQALRVEAAKWEIKTKGLSISQIERYARDCDFSKSYRTEVASSKPPSYKKPEPSQPVNPDELEAGDIVTPLFTPGDSYEVIQVMPNGILDCKSLRTGVQMGMRPSAVTLVQKAESSDTTEDLTDPSLDLVACILQEGDVVEVVNDRYPQHAGKVGTVEAILRFSELPISVRTPVGTKGYERRDLKLISKAEKPQQPTGLQAGTVLMGNRIVTTGSYTGLARRNAIHNARTGQADKLAAIELMRSGLSREEAMAAVTGTAADDLEF